jgi:hypothetical protein
MWLPNPQLCSADEWANECARLYDPVSVSRPDSDYAAQPGTHEKKLPLIIEICHSHWSVPPGLDPSSACVCAI